mmetsp:Transcript_41316/g.58135  ORF Transcript_41316/g.58135 Transcript_41316/m.58135 type:complete len:172 (-) Transcript_41316:324-839(-)
MLGVILVDGDALLPDETILGLLLGSLLIDGLRVAGRLLGDTDGDEIVLDAAFPDGLKDVFVVIEGEIVKGASPRFVEGDSVVLGVKLGPILNDGAPLIGGKGSCCESEGWLLGIELGSKSKLGTLCMGESKLGMLLGSWLVEGDCLDGTKLGFILFDGVIVAEGNKLGSKI